MHLDLTGGTVMFVRFFVLAICIVSCQSLPADSFALKKYPLSLGSDAVVINLSAVQHLRAWVVAVRISDSRDSYIFVGRSATPDPVPVDKPLTFMNIEPSQISIDKGSVFLRTSDMEGSVLIGVGIPASRRVRIVQDGSTVADTTVTNSLMIRNGTLIAEPLLNWGHAMLRVNSPPTLEAAPAPITKARDGTLWVNSEVLLQHFHDSAPLAFPKIVNTCNCTRRAVIVLKIDAYGNITEVRTGGDTEVAHAAEGIMRQWSFLPIQHEGKPVAVQGVIHVTLAPSGQVRIQW
jgi:hypothetical protein